MARRSQSGAGTGEALVVWALFALFVGAAFWTYARLPARDFFHVSTSGPSGGAGRALVYLNYPTALVAVAIAPIAADRLRGRASAVACAVAVGLSAAIFWPGIVNQRDLDARWVNAIPAAGVALAVALTLVASRRGVRFAASAPGDRSRLVLGAIVVLLGLEYVTGEFGVYVDRVPLLGWIFEAREPWAAFGEANLRPTVHLGHHHGFAGAELALSALLLSRALGTMRRRRLQAFVALYLAVMLSYGLANEVQDVWGEQLVKRGAVAWAIPSVNEPSASPAFVAVIAAGIALYAFLFRRWSRPRPHDGRRLRGVVFAAPALAAVTLAVLGATADGRTIRTTPPSAGERDALRAEGGIVFPGVDEGWDLIAARGDGEALRNLTPDEYRDLAPAAGAGGLAFQTDRAGNADVYARGRRVTRSSAADGEPAWSPDGRALAFVSSRNGNRELYVANLAGGGQRRLTHSPAADEWPAWSKDGRLVFQSDRGGDFDLYLLDRSGTIARLAHLPGDERLPAWAPDGKTIAFAADAAGSYDLYVIRADRTGLRRLTRDDAEDFAPAWSPSGRFLVFGSDRDGRDQLFVVRKDGSGLARLTDTQADKDAPAWR